MQGTVSGRDESDGMRGEAAGRRERERMQGGNEPGRRSEEKSRIQGAPGEGYEVVMLYLTDTILTTKVITMQTRNPAGAETPACQQMTYDPAPANEARA